MIRWLTILLLIVGCEEVLEPQDCVGVSGGTASIDDCGTCTGGTTGLEVNYLMDCSNTCNGGDVLDNCGICDTDSMKD